MNATLLCSNRRSGDSAGGHLSTSSSSSRRRCRSSRRCSPQHIPLLCRLAVLTLLTTAVKCWSPTRPKPLTGATGCTLPIRNFFVAGIGFSFGPGFGTQWVCSDAGALMAWGTGGPYWQQRFDMSAPDSATFPKNADGTPDLRYLYPAGAPITQMIVLHAPNPWGSAWGNIPAVIFSYLTDEGLRFAICGNADYAMAYLEPGRHRPPPTPVTLKAQFSNPLSEEGPPRFLSSFDGKCSIRGSGYLGGDPNKMSRYHLKAVKNVCFAPYAPYVPLFIPPTQPPQITRSVFKWTDYEPCFYSKHAEKKGGGGTSWSCAVSGTSIAVGKYSAIQIGKLGTPVEVMHGGEGQLIEVAADTSSDMFRGTDPQATLLGAGDGTSASGGAAGAGGDPVTQPEALVVDASGFARSNTHDGGAY